MWIKLFDHIEMLDSLMQDSLQVVLRGKKEKSLSVM